MNDSELSYMDFKGSFTTAKNEISVNCCKDLLACSQVFVDEIKLHQTLVEIPASLPKYIADKLSLVIEVTNNFENRNTAEKNITCEIIASLISKKLNLVEITREQVYETILERIGALFSYTLTYCRECDNYRCSDGMCGCTSDEGY